MTLYKVSLSKEEEINKILENLPQHLPKVDSKQCNHVTMLLEDFLINFTQANPEKEITLQVDRKLGELYIKITQTGDLHNPLEAFAQEFGDLSLEEAPDPLTQIQKMLYQTYGDGIVFRRRGKVNSLILKIKSPSKQLFLNLWALVLAFVAGAILPMFLPETVLHGLVSYLFTPIKTIFMNLLNFIMVPLVFCSIITCVGSFTNLSELGRVGGKTMGTYFLTSFLAVVLSTGVHYLLPSSAQGIQIATDPNAEEIEVMTISLLDTFLDIFPSNIIAPFAEANLLQLIFAGLFMGTMLSVIGEKGKPLLAVFESANALAVQMISFVVIFLPLVTFSIVTTTMIEYGIGVLMSLLGLSLTVIFTLFLMFLIYGVLVFVMGGKNPVIMYKKCVPAMVTAFSLSSSSATIPTSTEVCRKLGVPSRISAFTIPLGASINMDGACALNMLSVLFLTDVYGIEMTIPMLISLGCLIVSISVGLPGMPGAAVVGLTMAVSQVGLPLESVGIVVGIQNLLEMFCTASNVMGDISVTVGVTASEKILDDEMYKAKA